MATSEWKHRRNNGELGIFLRTPYIASASLGFTCNTAGCAALSSKSVSGSRVRGINWKSMLQRPQFCPASVEAERNGVFLSSTALQNSLRSLVLAMKASFTNVFPLLLMRLVTVSAAPGGRNVNQGRSTVRLTWLRDQNGLARSNRELTKTPIFRLSPACRVA